MPKSIQEAQKAWDLWEMNVFRKVQELEYLIAAVQADMSAAGVNRVTSRSLIDAKITDMREQIQEAMQQEKKRRVRRPV